jgi:hypothetical protein
MENTETLQKTAQKNPYTDSENKIVRGKEFECFEWARARELERIATLPPEEQKLVRRAEKTLQARMQSGV